jgi:hypothetical protein
MIVAKSKLARTLQIGLAATIAATGAVALFSAPAQAAAATLSPTTGTDSTKVIVAVTGTGYMNAAKVAQVSPTVGQFGVVFSSAACATARPSAATSTLFEADKVSVASATRLIVTTPNTLTLGTASAPKAWNLCVYKTGGPANTLLSNATYTVYAAPTLTDGTGGAPEPIEPVAGGVAGGETVTVNGTGFSAKTTAKLEGKAFTNIVVAKDGKSFTATVPAGVAGASDLLVTTEGGTTIAADGNDKYTYQNAITVEPSSGWDGTTVTIHGAGFAAALDTTVNANAAVLFTASGAAYTVASEKLVILPAAITIVSDNEIVFDIPSSIATVAKSGAYNLIVTKDKSHATGGAANPYMTVVSSGSSITIASF